MLIRRRQMRKSSATISPDVLVKGPKVEERTHRWTGEYREEIQDFGGHSGSVIHSEEPPAYIKRA